MTHVRSACGIRTESLIMKEVNNNNRFICSFLDCPASYDKEWKLAAHLCKHTGVRPFECEHEGCTKSFCTKSHLARHQLTHSGERPYRCAEDGCAESFTTNSNLKKHVSRKHKLEVKLYTCTHEGCGKTFKKNNLLKLHESLHAHRLPYECSYDGCERRFVSPSKRKIHEKVHQGYPCPADGCTVVAKNWTELTKHRKEHVVRVQCEECKKTFRDSWFLKQHQRVHAESRQVFRCPREGCDRSYTTAFNLQSHILSFHEQERSFTCAAPGCGRSFSMKQSLQRHSVVHDPDRQKQKNPRPTRSLASRLSGYKPPKAPKPESPAPPPEDVPEPSSRDADRLVRDLCTLAPTAQTETDETTSPPGGADPEPADMEETVILILEPLVLVNPTDDQSELELIGAS